MIKRTQKILGTCVCLPIAFGPFFVSTSCSKPYVFSWSGYGETFTRNYQKYPKQTVSKDQVVNLYFKNAHFQQMIGQDITFKMNQDWDYWDSDLLLKYKVSTSVQGNRLSWDLQITDDHNNILLWWTVKRLEYVFNLPSNLTSSQIQIFPKNVTFDGSSFHIDEKFWDDPVFEMIIKHRENKDQQFLFAYDFSFKTSTTDKDRLYEIIEYIVLTPWYYDGVTVEVV